MSAETFSFLLLSPGFQYSARLPMATWQLPLDKTVFSSICGPSGPIAHSRSCLSACLLMGCLPGGTQQLPLPRASISNVLTGQLEILSSQTLVARRTHEKRVLCRLSAHSRVPGHIVGTGRQWRMRQLLLQGALSLARKTETNKAFHTA